MARRPFTGAWIETRTWYCGYALEPVAPSRGRGLKQEVVDVVEMPRHVAPSRGRGLKQ